MGRKSRAKARRRASRIRSQTARSRSLTAPQVDDGSASVDSWVTSISARISEPTPMPGAARHLTSASHLAPSSETPAQPIGAAQSEVVESLAALARLVANQRAASEAVSAEVVRLRSAGVRWTDIGRALGVSRQDASQRYGALAHPEITVDDNQHDPSHELAMDPGQ